MTTLTVADLTQTTLEGTGVFDVLMRANKAHLEAEFNKNRIKGTEYATVYLGSLEAVMRASLEFLLQKDKNALEAQLLEQQIILAQVQVQKANAELAIIQASLPKVAAEIAHIQAQAALTVQQKANLVDELLTASIKRTQLTQQTANLIDELLTASAQRNKLAQETTNLAAQKINIDVQSDYVRQQAANLAAQALNIPKEGLVLDNQICKLKAEFDLLSADVLKVGAEQLLLKQKTATETAQIVNTGVDDNSVIGKQKALYAAQTSGFKRDAEQKATKILVDTWNVRMTAQPDETDTIYSNDEIRTVIGKLTGGLSAANGS